MRHGKWSLRGALFIACLGFANIASPQRYALHDGVVTDPRSGLAWRQSDNGTEISWPDAVKACAAPGDGWRLPSIDELEALYDPAESVACGGNFCHAASVFVLSGGWFWSGEGSGTSQAWGYNLDIGRRDLSAITGSSYGRALCVRGG